MCQIKEWKLFVFFSFEPLWRLLHETQDLSIFGVTACVVQPFLYISVCHSIRDLSARTVQLKLWFNRIKSLIIYFYSRLKWKHLWVQTNAVWDAAALFHEVLYYKDFLFICHPFLFLVLCCAEKWLNASLASTQTAEKHLNNCTSDWDKWL